MTDFSIRLGIFLAAAMSLNAMDKARFETRVDEAVRQFGVTGRGVLVAILDRGLDYRNNDFRNQDGTTRIDTIFDLTDNAGANAAGNIYKTGTIYTRDQINAALNGGTPLTHRDAVGHGTTTTGIAAGNGRNSREGKYRGVAPKTTLLIIKIVAGAVAHDDQPAEPSSDTLRLLPTAITFARDKAKSLGMPMVMLANVGSVGGPMDGSSALAQQIDSTVGPGVPGLAFVSGSSDDGGKLNHAQSALAQGQSTTLELDKTDAGSIVLDLWYPQTDRYQVTLQTPSAKLGPYAPPATNTSSDSQNAVGVSYIHYGSSATSFGPAVTRREIRIMLSGAAGHYIVGLTAATGGGGKFDAWINTNSGNAQFTNLVVDGYTVWDGASAKNNIVPNDYVVREKWADINGVVQGIRADHVYDLWPGSGIGPTPDGRLGIDVSAPGNTVFASLAPNSVYATNKTNQIQDGNGFYTAQNAVSAAAPQVTGIIALMLEMNPSLDAVQIKQILQKTARRDAYTGDTPNTRWGYGKVDAFAAVMAASQMPGGRPYFSLGTNEMSGTSTPQAEGATSSSSPVEVTAGNGAGAFTISSSAAWLSASPASGTAPASINVVTRLGGLSLGDYDGELQFSSNDGKAVPQTLVAHQHVRNPGPFITGVTDGAAFGPGFANGSWLTITGFDLASTTRSWTDSDFKNGKLPTSLDGVSVAVFDRPGFVYFISPNQINILAPDNTQNNTRFGIAVSRNGQTSNTFISNTLPRNPEFFRFGGRYIAAVHTDGAFVAPRGFFGAQTRPAAVGETVLLFGTGCGETSPRLPSDTVITGAAPVSTTSSLTIGGKPATTTFVGLVGNGLCQVNAVIPSLPSGDAEVVLTIGTSVSADATFLPIQ